MTEQEVPEFLIDSRSAAEVDDSCGMKYWWSDREDGTGIVPINPPDYLTDGSDIHEDLAAIAGTPDLRPEALAELFQPLLTKLEASPSESLARRIGWALAFGSFLEPRIREEFETVQTEAEIVLDRDPYFLPIVPDRVLEHRQDKYLVYREYKSTITASAKWIASWQFAVQLHAGIAAIQEELDREVKYGQIMGLLKGDKRDDRLSHPFVYGWRSSKTGAWTHEYAKARGADFAVAPTWQYPGGILAWIAKLGPDVCLGQFPHSYPVFLNDRLLTDWINRREARLWQVESVKEAAQSDWDTRVIYFEPRTKQCRPPFGDECPYLKQCWNAAYNENPTLGGEMIARVPHHDLERIGFK